MPEITHKLAELGLSGQLGREIKHSTFTMPTEYAAFPLDLRYAHTAVFIAQNAPLRLIPCERIVGSATLKEDTDHAIPPLGMKSTTHTTPGWHKALTLGYCGIRKSIEQRLQKQNLDEKGIELLKAMQICLDAADIWHQRYMQELTKRIASSNGIEKQRYEEVRNALANVPNNPPRNFYEAVQSLWFMYSFNRLMGNWLGIGRIDEMLGPYLQRDIKSGVLTIDDARDILAHFWIKGTE